MQPSKLLHSDPFGHLNQLKINLYIFDISKRLMDLKLILCCLLVTFAFSLSLANKVHEQAMQTSSGLNQTTVTVNLASLVKSLANQFTSGCKIGSTIGNFIAVANNLTTKLNLAGEYIKEGKPYKAGFNPIQPKDNSLWVYTKAIGTGSSGSLVFNVDADTNLVIVYQNPLFQWNFANVCLKPKGLTPKQYYETVRKSSNSDCILMDNTAFPHTTHFSKNSVKSIKGYLLGVDVKYQLQSVCYLQQIAVVIAK